MSLRSSPAPATGGAFDDLCNEILFGMLSDSPDFAVTLGLDDVSGRSVRTSGLPDFSEAADERRSEEVADWSRRLAACPPRADTNEQALTRAALEFVFEHGFQFRHPGRAGHGLAIHADPITPLNGVHAVAVELLARGSDLETPAAAQRHLETWSELPRALDQTRARMASRAARGLFTSTYVLDRTLAALRGAIISTPSGHAFLRAFVRRTSKLDTRSQAMLHASASSLLTTQIYPAYERLIAELEIHRPHARPAISAADLPGGDAWYAWRFAGHTTTAMSPEAAHALGLEELSRIRELLVESLGELGMTGDLHGSLERWAQQEAFEVGAPGREQALSLVRGACDAAREGVRRAFNLWPDADVEVLPVAEADEASSHSYYVPPRADGSHPGVFWLNLALTVAQPRAEATVLAFHEAWPGHHLQLCVAQQARLAPLRRALLFNAYLEGWAKYAESLPETLGIVGGVSTRIARLRTELYSTATLVFDTGVHVHGWSADRARSFFIEQTGASAALADIVVLRSAANPAQLCAYKIGLLKLRSLQDRYARDRGGAYDMRDFHDAYLRRGALPLDVLERAVLASAAQERRA